MSDQTIFSSSSDQDTSNQNNQQQSQTQTDTSGQFLATLVGEGRKYKTPDELAKAYLNADEFLEKLKSENATLREQLAKAKTIDDVLARLNAQESQTAQDQGVRETDTKSSLSASDVAAIVKDTLTGLETQRSRQENLRKADAMLRQVFGDKAAEVFAKEASTPEMRKALMDLASVSPEKFVAVFHKESQGSVGSQTDSTTKVNTAAMSQETAGGRVSDPGCKEFYDTLRRKDPKTYYSQQVQLQMTRAAEADPAKFFGRRS